VVGNAAPDIWVKQLPSGPLTRLTFETQTANRPRWTPDGQSVIYIAVVDSGFPAVWKKKADGSAAAELVWRVPNRPIAEALLSNDGQWLVYRVVGDSGNRDVYAVRPGRDTVAIPLLTDRFAEEGAALSPDGKWLAYASNESGRSEIFVRPFPNTAGGRWQISTAGGSSALWSHSGRELFFEAPSGDMMVAPITSTTTFSNDAPRRLFPLGGGLIGSSIVPLYATTPDDKRFLMVRLAAVNQAPGAGQLVVVDNWFTELKAKMGKK
jgi:Tol biopolymer transport system component